MSPLGKRIISYITHPGLVNSVLLGSCMGSAIGIMCVCFKAMNYSFFDSKRHPYLSRLRYQEKQLLFERENEERETAHATAKLVAEYDPIACRLPFTALDSKYLI
eukprot:GHVR01063699.1.p1 GENE.GHVR01063699.1~~GHVR01063699.1.p1  ORF type:complete len:105 (+),score=3.14 GHVR01063699.1:19-333(+)